MVSYIYIMLLIMFINDVEIILMFNKQIKYSCDLFSFSKF